MRLDRGEWINESLAKIAGDFKIDGATISGIGAIQTVEVGCYCLEKKEFAKKTFNGTYELINLTGNISWKHSDPIVHTHAAFVDKEFIAFGGHLFDAQITVTGELSIRLMPERLTREWNEELGRDLLSCQASQG